MLEFRVFIIYRPNNRSSYGKKVMTVSDKRTDRAIRVTWTGFFWNVLLMLFKLAAGIVGQSAAMIADAVHSLSDFVTDIFVVIGLSIVKKPADSCHKYGHGKVETLCSVIIGIMLFGVGTGILWSGTITIYKYFLGQAVYRPGLIALLAAVISIAVKEILYRYTIHAGKRIDSQALMANAWHHRSDALTSVGTTIGIGGAVLLGDKWRILDPLAAVIVSLVIIKVSIKIIYKNIQELLEGSLSEEIEQEILLNINRVKGVKNPHNLRTRRVGNAIAIDMHIMVDAKLSIVEAHNIATETEKKLRDKYGIGTIISIHVEPYVDLPGPTMNAPDRSNSKDK